MDAIRVGVIGSGGIFRNLHTPYYETTDRAEIVAICDLVEERATAIAEPFGADVCTDCRDVLTRDDVDAVVVSTQPGPRCAIAVAAAEAGKHIFAEKPMCCDVAEGSRMIAAADAAGVALNVAYMQPFNPVYRKLKEMLTDGTLGQVHLAYGQEVGWFRPEHPWLFVQAESGGMLVEQAIHTLDIWLWLYGPIASVYGRTSHVPLGGTYPEPALAVENNAVFIAEFASGATGMFIKSWAAEVGTHSAGVVCANGSADWTGDRLTWKTHGMSEPETFRPTVPDDDTFRSRGPEERQKRYWSWAQKGASIEHWLKCITGEEQPTTGGSVGRAGVEIAEAAYRSAATSAPVTLPL